MSDIKSKKQSIVDTESVQYVAATLRDISAVALRDLTARFSRNTSFYDELERLYELVWRIAEQVDESSSEKKILTNKKVLHVAYTTNRHFYGSLNYDVMRLFQSTIGSGETGMVIGKTGYEIWQNTKAKHANTQFVSFAEDAPNTNEVKAFMEDIALYGRVFITYPRFISIYQQKAETVDVSFRPKKERMSKIIPTDIPKFVLEPDLIRVQRFFLSQVRAVLFDRILLETELSRVATRLLRMDMADTAAHALLQKERLNLQHEVSVFMNTRLLESITGYSEWLIQNK
ncbi:MAG: F0F1 ATP synthase subunit gamma [Candidatus Pacebacteria bacterium]|nr:F0F1 ATP synthase subunit gamma [Candidatus Paceibacterota bacterium]